MKITLIVAVSENNVIGRDGKLPWDLPDDLKRFRQLTKGHTVIMGRKTHESIGRPLPDRRNIIITRQSEYMSDGCEVVHSLDEALALCVDDDAFVIGGGEIYAQALVYAHRIELTRVHTDIEGDAFFPDIDETQWKLESKEEHNYDENHAYAFTYETWIKA
jgi:dihydrofolate reductase